jgi:hypothetical protein
MLYFLKVTFKNIIIQNKSINPFHCFKAGGAYPWKTLKKQ